jgi:phage gpG-like protein
LADFSIRVVGGQELQIKLKQLSAEAREILRGELAATQLAYRSAVQRRMRGEVLHRRSGTLVSSVTIESIEDTGDNMVGAVGTNEEYARIHELGGTISAKNVRNLTIPLAAMLTGRGVARAAARQVIADPAAFGLTGTFFKKGVLFGKKGKDEVTPLFALKPSVTMPARPTWGPALEEVKPEFESRLTGALERVLA